MPPVVEAARIRAEAALKAAESHDKLTAEKIRVDTDRDRAYVESQNRRDQTDADARMEELRLKERIADLTYQTKIAEFALSIQTQGGVATAGMMRMGTVVAGLGRAVPYIGVALMAAGAAFLYFGAKAEESKQRVADMTAALIADNGVIGTNTRAYLANALVKQGLMSDLNRMGIDISRYTDAMLGDAAAIKEINAQLEAASAFKNGAGSNAAQQANTAQEQSIKRLNDALNGSNAEMKTATENAQGVTAATKTAASVTQEHAASAADAAKAIQAQATAAKNAADEIKAETDAMWGDRKSVV